MTRGENLFKYVAPVRRLELTGDIVIASGAALIHPLCLPHDQSGRLVSPLSAHSPLTALAL